MTMHVSSSEIIAAIKSRVSTNLYDPSRTLTRTQIEDLVALATRAPSAYNLQNWRFVAVSSAEGKARLQAASFGQAKVGDAAVTFILVGKLPSHEGLAARLQPSVDAGYMPQSVADGWVEAVAGSYGGDALKSRDEAVRSATFAAAFLVFAAHARGLASGAMVGFEPERVSREFGLAADEIPVMLMTVGYAAPGNWPQKPRVPAGEVIAHA
ncbi:nitroreductase family protein [Stappia sp.]|uniref:nitroreductase family protein n=1 Tax=Stappia sp. TaxID=1870903 RepID=UPI003A9943EE